MFVYASPLSLTYGYDRHRLTSVTGNDFAFIGGRSYDYAAGQPGIKYFQREQATVDGEALTYDYNSEPAGTRLGSWHDSDWSFGESYFYDRDGRVGQRNTTEYIGYYPAGKLLMGFSGRSSVYATANPSAFGAAFQYLYDGDQRRVRKTYPTGTADEFFYGPSRELLEDRGNETTTVGGAYPIDEYVWLGGKAVMLVRSKFSSSWARITETGSSSCQRNGKSYLCGQYFIVNDHLPKPRLLLDSSGKVVGAAQYDPFGHPNRQFMVKETAHPYADNMPETLLGTCDPKVYNVSNLRWRTRVGFHRFSTEQNWDFVRMRDSSGGLLWSSSGPKGSPFWSPWYLAPPTDRKVDVTFSSDGSVTKEGVNTQYCEYQVYDSTIVDPFWVSLRLPGQYFDEETELFENWNRYYDPWTGRYLQPDPILSDPEDVWLVEEQYRQGSNVDAYAYAHNNPMRFTDTDGRFSPMFAPPPPGWSPTQNGNGLGDMLMCLIDPWSCVPPDRNICGTPRKQTCTAKCPVIVFDPQPSMSYPTYTFGYGSNCDDAEREARQKTPRGSRTRHCGCTCK